MIEAWFTTNTNVVVPVAVPNDEVLEIAALAGRSLDDLFSIEIPAGASRHTRIRCLVHIDDVDTLYESTRTVGSATFAAAATFHWREHSLTATQSINVFLLPPKPLFVNASALPNAAHGGVLIVEAVDERYLWHRKSNALASTLPQRSSYDGRWDLFSDSIIRSTPERIADLVVQVGGYTEADSPVNLGSLSVPFELEYRLNDFNPSNASIAMLIDCQLAAVGYMLVWNAVPFSVSNGAPVVYGVIPIVNSNAQLKAFMIENKRAVAGGTEAPSKSYTATGEPLSLLWNGTNNWQKNRGDQNASVFQRAGRPCTDALYENTRNGWASSQYVSTSSISTSRPRNNLGTEMRLSEIKPEPFGSDYLNAWYSANFIDAITSLASTRVQITIGRVAWAGWPIFPAAAFRGTMMKYCLAKRNGELVPISITDADEKDWIFGQDGRFTDDPSKLVMSHGDASARRVLGDILSVGAPPPLTRVFPAVITGNQRMGSTGSAYWKWKYSFVEVEPNAIGFSPMAVGIGNNARQTVGDSPSAMNFCEDGNIYNGAGASTNVIATGVRQSDYTNAIIDALPIVEGTIVMMCQHFPAVHNSGVGRTAAYPRYWFSIPNAVKVECATPFTGDTDYGFILAPTDLVGEYGTFDAEEGDTDYGGFSFTDFGGFSSPLNDVDFLYLLFDTGAPALDLGTY